MLELIFGLCLYNAFRRVNKDYSSLQNFDITYQAFLPLFILKLALVMIVYPVFIHFSLFYNVDFSYILFKEISFFGNLGNALSYILFVDSMIVIYTVIWLFVRFHDRLFLD